MGRWPLGILLVIAYFSNTYADFTSGACLCVTGTSVNVRQDACGGSIGKENTGVCYKYLDCKQTCDLSGTTYDFYAVDYVTSVGWIAGQYLQESSDATQCSSSGGFSVSCPAAGTQASPIPGSTTSPASSGDNPLTELATLAGEFIDKLKAVTDKVKALKSDISKKLKPVTDLVDAINEVKTSITELKDSIDKLKDFFKTLKTNIKDLKSSISDLKAAIKDLKSSISINNLKNTYNKLDATIKSFGKLKATAKQLKPDLKQLKTSFNKLKSSVNELKTSINGVMAAINKSVG